jgi:Heterokaryon incompatibility protein (HET)
MGDIYRKAASVIAWLGWPQGWDPKMVFQFITLDSWDSWEFLARDDSRKSWGLTYGELLRMVLKMCTCRYWSRRWIVQEILLARNITIMCGENDMSWQRLHSFIQRLVSVGLPQELLTKKALEATLPFPMSDYKYGGLGGRKYALTIRQLLAKFGETDCEVLHDRVYSLLSLASDGNRLSVD